MLDKNRPYGEVFGMPPVRYVQDGKEYKADGTPVISDKQEQALVELANEEIPMPQNLGRAKNGTLKALMEQAGQEWTDRKSAIAYLKEQHNG